MKDDNLAGCLAAFREATRRWSEGVGDRDWREWQGVVAETKRTWESTVPVLLRHADRGGYEVWHVLGEAFQGGRGVERDLAEAESWFRKAADAGHTPSMVRLGLMLTRPERTQDELVESVEWFRRAADLGDSGGMTWMGFAYREGTGVPVDERQAADWFIKAYHAGSKTGCELAGRLLSYRKENHPEAVKWLRIAVERGIDNAYYNLALIHEDRDSPAHDPAEAFRCWGHVAERPRGELRFDAMHRLASCCRDGIGTERNPDDAKRWLDRLIATAPEGKARHRAATKLRKEMDEELL